jgi:transcription elongation factor Elf1
MEKPNCPKCGHTEFSVRKIKASGENDIEVLFCSKCGAIVGCPPSLDHDHMLEILNKLDIQY